MQTLPPEAFEGERLHGVPAVVAVCFHARWCGFCRAFLPLFNARSASAGLPFALADISSTSDPRWDALSIKVIPSLVLFKDGAAVWRKQAPLGVGLREADIDRMLDAALRLR